jgi:D-glycero-alpha-D-manno-heptose-7-phosphate kinase
LSQTITFQSPTRVDLAGGTLDCWPLYLFLGDPLTVNVAIDIFTTASLTPRADKQVKLKTRDLGQEKVYPNIETALSDSEPAFDLVRAHLEYWKKEIGTRGFDLETASDSPVGGGLGGSSSLCISLLKVFQKWTGRTLSEADVVRLASHLEARILLKPTGTQDYFPPLAGGLCYITYGAEGPRCERTPIDLGLFEERFVLVYTGRSHHSGINNWQVIKDWLDGDSRTRQAMSDLAVVSKDLAGALKSKNIDLLPGLFEREYEARTRLSEGFSSPEIRRLHELAKKFGAQAKICGAGGGGCVMIWSQERRGRELRAACVEAGFKVLDAKPWSPING